MATSTPTPVDEETVYRHAAAEYGESNQLLKAMEEAVELQAAILDYLRGQAPVEDVLEEAADVQVMTRALPYAIGRRANAAPSTTELTQLLADLRAQKIERQAGRLGLD